MNTRSRTLVVWAIFAAFSGLIALIVPETVLAQTGNADKSDDPALKGPAVGERPGAKGKSQSGFGPDAVAKNAAKKPSGPLSMAEFMKSVDVLRGGTMGEGERITSEEDAKIKALASEFETSTTAYMALHKREIDALRAKLSPNDRTMLDEQLQRGGAIKLSKYGFGGKSGVLKQKAKGTGEPNADTQTLLSKDETAKMRARLVELYAGRPKVEDVQAKILGVLSPEQLKIVEERLAKQEAMGLKKRGRGKKAKED